jgi:hypothetical protein
MQRLTKNRVFSSFLKEGASIKEDNVRIEFEQGNCYSRSVQCVYQGPVRDGKPHGMGVWIDTSLQGREFSRKFLNEQGSFYKVGGKKAFPGGRLKVWKMEQEVCW